MRPELSWFPPGLEIRENGKGFTQNTGKNYTGKLKTTGKVGEIYQAVIVKTMQIWYHTLNKKYWKTAKNTGKVWEICQSEKVGTVTLPQDQLGK